MNNYVVVIDTCADLTQDMINQLNISDALPLSLKISEDTFKGYADEKDITFKDFYARLRSGEMSVTSQINVDEFTNCFEKHLSQGKDVLYLGFSSGLSGTVNSARIASEDLMDKYPDNRVVIVDTLGASMGQGLLVYKACNLRNEGKSIDEVALWANENKKNVCHWFTVDDLNFLKRGGRLSSASAIVGTVLQVKPILTVDDAGKLVAAEKARGRRQSIDTLAKHLEEKITDRDIAFISHGDCLEEAEYLADLLKTKHGVKEVCISYVGTVIGGHSGPGTLALFFMGSEN